MRTTVRWMLPAAGALATALAMAPNAEASGFFSSEPTSPTVVDTPLTWSFAANGGEQCDLSSDAGVTDSRPCGTGQYQYTPTTAGTYTLTVSDPSTAPATTLGTSAAVEVHPATPTVTRAGGSAGAPSWSFTLPTGATATCTVAAGTTTLSSTSCSDPFTTDLSSDNYGDYVVGVVVHENGLDSDQGTVSYTLRPPAPSVTLSTPASSPSNATQPTFTISDNAAGAAHTFACSVTGPGGFSTTLASCDTTSPTSVDLSSAPLDGTFTLHVLETADGVAAVAEGTATYRLDRSISPVSLVLNPTAGGRTVTGHVTESDTDGITYVCSILQLPTLLPTSCGASTTFDLPASAGEGGYTITVTAKDGAGNTTSDTASYTLDVSGPAAAPTATASPASPGTSKHVTWTLQPTEAGEAFTCGATTAGATAVCSGNTVTLDISGTDGSYTVTVHTADSYGNPGVPFDLTYVLDATAPAAPASSGSATTTGHLRSTSWTIIDADQGGDLDHYRCTVDTPAGGNATATCSATTGQVTLTISPTSPNGSYVVDVYAVDALGNENVSPLALTYTLDTQAPAAATVTDVPGPGSTGTTGFSRSPSWSIGNVEPGASVTCSATGPGGPLAAARVTCSASAVTLDLSTLADGSYSVTATVTDAAGNSTDSTPVTYLLDTQFPAAATVSPVTGPGSTGTTGYSTSPSWSISNVESGATVTCAVTGPGGSLAASKVACSSTAVTLNLTGLADGTYTVTVTLTDAAGNATTSSPASYVFDTHAPAPPTLIGVAGAGSTGATGYSRSPSWSIGNVEPGAAVTCTATGPGGAMAAGRISCLTNKVTLDLATLSDGSYQVTVTVTDAAGNAISASATYVLDTAPPAAPTVTAVPGPGSTGTTGFSTSPSWSVSAVEPGATVSCTVTGPSGTVAASKVSCSATAVTLNLSGLIDGAYSVTVTVTDAAGNGTSAPAVGYVLDTVAPAASILTPVTGPGDTGTTGSVRTPSWTLSNVESGASVTCTATGPAGALASNRIGCGSTVSLNLAGMADGNYSVTVTVTDAAGNATATGATYRLDTVPPAAPTVTPVVKSGSTGTTGFSRSPSWTVGAVEPGAVISCAVARPDGTALDPARVSCGTTTTLDLTGLSDGSYTLVVSLTDAAGNTTSAAAVSYLLDTLAPTAPTVTPVAGPGTTGTTGFSRSPSWSVTGVEPGAVISCMATGPAGAVASTAVSCGPTLTLNLNGLSDGAYHLTVTVTDAAGNTTSAPAVSYLLDTQPPAAATVTAVAGPGTTGTTGNSALPSWTVTGVEPGASISCAATRPDGTALDSSRVSCGPTTTLDLAGLSDGAYTLRVTVTDVAGNATTSAAVAYVFDTAAPTAPTVTPVAGPGSTGTTGFSRHPAWSVTGVEPGAVISCAATGPGGMLAASRVTCGPATQLDLSGLADGTYRLTVTLTDAAGNSTTAGSVTYLLDTVAPAAASVTPVSGPGSTGTTGYSRSPSWTVTGVEPGATISCVVTGPGGTVAASAVNCGSTVIANLNGLADGAYSLVVTVTDAAGNATSAAPVDYLLDTAPPAAPSVTAVPGAGSTGTTGFSTNPSWSVGAVEPGAVIACAVAGPGGAVPSGLVTCGSTVSLQLASLADGSYSLVVSLTDAAGNIISAQAVSYVLDRLPPPAPTLAGGIASTTGNAFGFSWSISDSDPQFDIYQCTVTGPAGSAATVTCGPTGAVVLSIPAGAADGAYTVSVFGVDAAGNVSQAPLTLSYVLDTVAPARPTVTPVVQPGSTGLTGFSRTPTWRVTNVENGAAYSCQVVGPAGTVAASSVTCGPTITVDLNGLTDGNYTLTVTLTDAAGNSVDSTPVSYLLDTAAPPAAVVTPVPATGTTGTTGFSRNPSWSVSGVEPGAAISCDVTGPSGALLASRVACGTTVVLNLNGQADGLYTLTVTLTDAAGNSTSSAAQLYVLDTVAPPAPTRSGGTANRANTRTPGWGLADVDPTVTYTCQVSGPAGYSATVDCSPANGVNLSIAAGSPDGTYVVTVNATDPAGNVNAAPLVFTYILDTIGPARPTSSSVASPSSSRQVTWSLTGTEASETYTCTVDGGATVTCAGSSVQLSLAALPDGAYHVTVTPHDDLGNPGVPLTLAFLLDTTGPAAPRSSVIASPGATRSLVWTLTGTESPETYTCALTAGTGAAVTCSGATVQVSLAGAADGPYAVTVTPFDALGNPGTPITLTYTLDTTGPIAPSASPVASPDQRRSVRWTLTATEAGESYACVVSGAGASVGCDLTGVTLNLAGAADGTYVVTVTPIDALGNRGTPRVLSYTLDTTGPVLPQIVSAPASPAQPRTAGWSVTDAESPVTYQCTQSGPVAFSVTCGASVSLTLPAGAPDGAYMVTVTPYDALLNAGSPLVLTYVLDTTAPVAPVLTITSPGNDLTPTPTVVTEPGVTLTCGIQRYFLPVATVACGSDGTVDLSAWGDGEYEISVWATDAAGNVGAASAPYIYLLDTVPPGSPTLTAPASPSPVVDPVWRWSAETDTTGTCTVTNAAGVVVTGPVACTDLFTGQFGALPDGHYTVSVVLADAAGNLSPAATSMFILDRTAPVPPTVVPPESPSNSTDPRWFITAPRGATLTCTLLRGRTVILGPGACPTDGVVSLDGQPDGTYTMRVTATDSAGNVSAASITTYVLDTAAPASPSLAYGSPSASSSRSPFWGFTLPLGTSGRCDLLQGGNVIASRSNCRGAVSFTLNGPDGSYVVRIFAVDAAGNVSSPLVIGYQLVGHGGGGGSVGGGTGTGGGSTGGGRHKPVTNGPEPTPPPVQRIIDHVGSLAGQAAKTVRKAANGVTSALPSIPVIHDPLTNNVSHAVQNVIDAVSKAGGGTGFPLLLLIVVFIFLMAQSRMDRRDPKLALASVAADDNLQFGPPPSRGDA